MFARLALKLYDNGWKALLPLLPGRKSPAIRQWERYNAAPPTEQEMSHWCETHPHAGIGLAAGPDQVIGCDLDFLDPDKAARARAINDRTLGASPLIRIGRRPKAMLFYRAAPGLHVPGKNYGGFEVFSNTGQTVLYGIHPETRQPYIWPEESPETLGPGDLPLVTQAALDSFLAEMSPLREDRATRTLADGKISTITNTGATATWLQHFAKLTTAQEMIAAASAGITGVGVGARHATMQAAVMALVTRGVSPGDFVHVIEEAYGATLSSEEVSARRHAVGAAARWANDKAWGGLVDVTPVAPKVCW